MAKIPCKGTLLELEISSVDTAVAQVIELSADLMRSLTFDSTDLSTGVGKTKGQTGYAEQGDISGTIFYDPAQATHTYYASIIATPAENNGNIVLADGSTTHLAFVGAGFGLGLAVDMNDGLKAPFSIECSGLLGFPTS